MNHTANSSNLSNSDQFATGLLSIMAKKEEDWERQGR